MEISYYHTDSLLHRLNPLCKLLAIFPVLAFVAFTTDFSVPGAFAILISLIVLILGHIPLTRFIRVAWMPLLLFAFFTLVYPFFVRPELVKGSPILLSFGPLIYYQTALLHVAQIALRAYAIILLSLFFSLTTDISDFIRALVQQWKFPYKIGYGTMAAFRFVPMLQSEMQLIQAAHKIRGIADHGGLRYARMRRYAIPLLSIALRRAERTALAMDSRAFGVLPRRTYYKRYSFSLQDYLFLACFWLACLLLCLFFWYSGLLGPLIFFKQF
ncbi:energy-coupling factor transporter transmembrane protein EcfT [Ktedonosporobacter rubrisoli]|uniref:Energy-coupling factor transporter transmembrane protein EcfT n=1 Tax=Ktedonosporobacter rubrisoli TaxID=2509675 RepID=A0A4P6JIG3_KTERU|nr:energy-coupling factor transporter transmembrane component T [Ktedonosporobacter rubrisoli]QBD74855.1 energy-coupling factor transporter transmembrane protein EcfT [Ktedonosporobacter rubrisoli]